MYSLFYSLKSDLEIVLKVYFGLNLELIKLSIFQTIKLVRAHSIFWKVMDGRSWQ